MRSRIGLTPNWRDARAIGGGVQILTFRRSASRGCLEIVCGALCTTGIIGPGGQEHTSLKRLQSLAFRAGRAEGGIATPFTETQ